MPNLTYASWTVWVSTMTRCHDFNFCIYKTISSDGKLDIYILNNIGPHICHVDLVLNGTPPWFLDTFTLHLNSLCTFTLVMELYQTPSSKHGMERICTVSLGFAALETPATRAVWYFAVRIGLDSDSFQIAFHGKRLIPLTKVDLIKKKLIFSLCF